MVLLKYLLECEPITISIIFFNKIYLCAVYGYCACTVYTMYTFRMTMNKNWFLGVRLGRERKRDRGQERAREMFICANKLGKSLPWIGFHRCLLYVTWKILNKIHGRTNFHLYNILQSNAMTISRSFLLKFAYIYGIHLERNLSLQWSMPHQQARFSLILQNAENFWYDHP